jgi:hypothetical protein
MEESPTEIIISNTNNNKDIIKKKIILKFLVRLYFFINHKLKLSQDKQGESSKYSQATKDEIVKRFFEEDSRKLNRLANSVDMLLIKPYFKKLCDDSYDNDCNSYRRYLNMQLKDGQSPDIISQNIIDAVKGYSEKYNAMSLNDQFIEEIRKMLSGTKSQISSEDFKSISKSISGILKQTGLQDFEKEIEDLDNEKNEINGFYEKKINELEEEFNAEKEKVNIKGEVIKKIEGQIDKKQKEINVLIKQRNETDDPETKASLTVQISQIETQIEEKEKELTKENKELEILKENIQEKEEKKIAKIDKLNLIKEKDLKVIKEKEEEKYIKQGAAFFIKLIKTKRNLWNPGFKETKANEYIDNPETSLTLFQELIEFKQINDNYETIKNINKDIPLLKELYSALRYLSTEVEDKNKDKVKKLYDIVERDIKELKISTQEEAGEEVGEGKGEQEKELYMEFDGKDSSSVSGSEQMQIDTEDTNIWEFIMQLPPEKLLESNKKEILNLASTILQDKPHELKFRSFFYYKLRELFDSYKQQSGTDDKLQKILEDYEDASAKEQRLKQQERIDQFNAATQPIKNISKAASEKIVEGVESVAKSGYETLTRKFSLLQSFYEEAGNGTIKEFPGKMETHIKIIQDLKQDLLTTKRQLEGKQEEEREGKKEGETAVKKQIPENTKENIDKVFNSLIELENYGKDLKEEVELFVAKYIDVKSSDDTQVNVHQFNRLLRSSPDNQGFRYFVSADIVDDLKDFFTDEKNREFLEVRKTIKDEYEKFIKKSEEIIEDYKKIKKEGRYTTIGGGDNKIIKKIIKENIQKYKYEVVENRKKTMKMTEEKAKEGKGQIVYFSDMVIYYKIFVPEKKKEENIEYLNKFITFIKENLKAKDKISDNHKETFIKIICLFINILKNITKESNVYSQVSSKFYDSKNYIIGLSNNAIQEKCNNREFNQLLVKFIGEEAINSNGLNETTKKCFDLFKLSELLRDVGDKFENLYKKIIERKMKITNEFQKIIEKFMEKESSASAELTESEESKASAEPQHPTPPPPTPPREAAPVQPSPSPPSSPPPASPLPSPPPREAAPVPASAELPHPTPPPPTPPREAAPVPASAEPPHPTPPPPTPPREAAPVPASALVDARLSSKVAKAMQEHHAESATATKSLAKESPEAAQPPEAAKKLESTGNKSPVDETIKTTYERFAPKYPNKEKYDHYQTLESIDKITSKIKELKYSTSSDTDAEYQKELSDLIKIIEDSNDASCIKDNPTLENRKIEINDLLNLIKVRYPNLKEITKENYDEYIKLREEELKKRQSDREEEYRTPNDKLKEYLKTIKENTYGDPIIPGAILGWTTINVVGDILNGDQAGEHVGAFFDSWGGLPGLDIIGDGLAGISDIVNLPFMIVSHLFHSLQLFISPTGIASFVVLKLILFGIPKLINFINGDGFKDPPSAEDILSEYVNQLQNINETNVDENKYFASMLVTMTYLTNLTNETINVKELNDYSRNVKKIFSILKEKDQDQIIEIILDYYVISMSMINTSNGDINTQKKRILKNTALFYFLLSKDPNMPFDHIFKNDKIKIKLVNKFDEYILDLTIKTFSLMSGVTTQSDKQMIKDIVIINSKSESDNSIKDKILMKYTPDQKAKEITVKIIENIEKNLHYGSSKVIGLFKFYFNKIETREKLLKGFFDQFHEKIISKKLISKIKPIFITKIINILDKQSILAKQEKEENEKMNYALDIYNIQNTIIEKLDKKDLYNENLENSDPQLLEEIYDYFDLIFKTFINHHDIKNKNKNSDELGWTFTDTDEPFTEAMENFRNFFQNSDLNNSTIYNSLIKILDYTPSIKIAKIKFREKLLKYLTLFIYKLNLSKNDNKYYRIPHIFEKNISKSDYNIFNSNTINSVKNLTNDKDYQHNTHISLLNNKLDFLLKDNNYNLYNYFNTKDSKFIPLCKLTSNIKEDQLIKLKNKLLIRNNHYIGEGIGQRVFESPEEKYILEFLNSFTIIRFEIKKNFKKNNDFMLNLNSQVIGFNNLIEHVKNINNKIINNAIENINSSSKTDDIVIYVDLMFPNEYFQDRVNKEKIKPYITNVQHYSDYENEKLDNNRFNSIRKYTLKVSDEDGYGNLKKFKHVLTPFHYFEYDNDNTKYYLQPKILDNNNLNEYFKQVYLEGGKEYDFQKNILLNLGIGGLTSAMLIMSGPLSLGLFAAAAIATNETLKQKKMISESTATKAFYGTLFGATAAVDIGDIITDIGDHIKGIGIPEGKTAGDILASITNGDAKNHDNFFITKNGEQIMVIKNATGDKIEISEGDFNLFSNDEKKEIAKKFFEQAKKNNEGFDFNHDDYHWKNIPDFMKSALKLASDANYDDPNHIDIKSLTDTFTSGNDVTLEFPGDYMNKNELDKLTNSINNDKQFKALTDQQVIEKATKYLSAANVMDEDNNPFFDIEWKDVPDNMKRALKFAMDQGAIREEELNQVFLNNMPGQQSLEFPTFLSREDFGDKFSNFIESDEIKNSAFTTADIGVRSVIDNAVDSIELKIKITSNIEDQINYKTNKQKVIFEFQDENNKPIAINNKSNITLNGEPISVLPEYIDKNRKIKITLESNKNENTLVVKKDAFAIIATGITTPIGNIGNPIEFSKDQNGAIITNKNKVEYKWTKTNETKGGQKSQIGGRNTNFSGNMVNSGLQEKYNKIASSVYTIDISNTNHYFSTLSFAKENYFSNPSSVNITKVDKIMIDLEQFKKITGSVDRVKEVKIYDIVTNQEGSDNVQGFWKGKPTLTRSDRILPCIHKDIDYKNLKDLFKDENAKFHGLGKDDKGGKKYINDFIEQNTILKKNMVDGDYYEYFTQLYNSTKFNNDKDYILVFSNPHTNNKLRSEITINEINDNPLVLLNHENYDDKINEEKVFEELINHLRNVYVNIKEKEGEVLPGVIILKDLKNINRKNKLITITDKSSQKIIDKMYKEEKESYAKKNLSDKVLSVGTNAGTGALLSYMLGSATDCLPLIGTLTKTGITITSAALTNEEDKKKIEEEYAKIESPFHRCNRFINTNLEQVKIPTIFEVRDKTSEIMGGKKRKRLKTVKKYRYIKNKTGKKRKKSEKIKIIKKNKNKMKISQAIIKHL